LRYDGRVNDATAMSGRAGRLRPQLLLLLILLLALVWRVALWAQPLHGPANDEVEYIAVARDLLAGRGWSFYAGWRWLRAPLYPLFLAGSLWLAGGDLHLAALPNLLLSVGVVYLVARLARELAPDAGPRPALIAAAVAALLQTHATFASLYMSETLFSLLFAAALLALARWQRVGDLWAVALAGALFGLACLTRSAALIFLPAAMLWLIWLEAGRAGRLRAAAALPALVMALCAALTIAPWTLRNCRAYGACILIETGFAYNLWAFYEPREELDEINRALEAIPNPAVRADVATERGLERLREDPAIVLRKLPAEWERLWVVKPIQDRFLLPSAYSDPPPPLFLSALILDDLLYLLVLCASAVGLATLLARRSALAALMALWIAVFVAATLLTHAEGRYRHFLFMALIPLAAVAAHELIGRRLPRPAALAAAALPLALALLPLAVYYPWQWAGSGAARSVYRWWGDAQAGAGRPEQAAEAYRAALRASETADGWIALGDLRRRQGDLAGAEEAYELAHLRQLTYVGASARLGAFLRAAGRDDEARAAFRGRYLDQASLLEWSFRFLDPPPVAAVDVGDGLDYGYVGGVYRAEEIQGALARWSDGRGLLRLAAGDGAALLTLRVAALHPDRETVPLQICAGEMCQEVTVGREWRELRVLLPRAGEPMALRAAAPGVIELRSPTFRAPDGRELGVLIDRAALEPALTTRTGSSGR
jgi:4-amino-4-deoxy-L-arabinose transferase-like glycosyltransferase